MILEVDKTRTTQFLPIRMITTIILTYYLAMNSTVPAGVRKDGYKSGGGAGGTYQDIET
ncbi:hypothetical protein SDC9_168429 [bioreactor metagenome]|uniref:Uncharacterized protein n=1 Tax=bioreactor metagenome TaxID=1076179 RepID=A0A645G550_9ZZZZ